MSKIVLGVVSDRDMAEHAIDELENSGFSTKDISIIMKDKGQARQISHNTGVGVVEGAASGATTGGLIGGLAGLLIGIGAIAIPGIGAILIGGPLAAALGLSGAAATTVSGAVTGALAGGLVGALVGVGVPEEDAVYYENRVRDGAILIAVPVTPKTDIEARGILEDHGAAQVRTISTNVEENPLRKKQHEYDDYSHLSGAKGGEVIEED